MPGRMCGHESCNVWNPAVTYKTSALTMFEETENELG